jgi:hypothetical protein
MGSYGRHGGRAAVSTRTVSCPCHVDACRRLHVDMIIAPTTTTAASMPQQARRCTYLPCLELRCSWPPIHPSSRCWIQHHALSIRQHRDSGVIEASSRSRPCVSLLLYARRRHA